MTTITPTLSHFEHREQLVAAAQALFANHVISRTGHANLSARVSEHSMLLTIEGQVRGLATTGLALVDFDGTVLEGHLDPANAEIVTMHSEVYRVRPDIGGIIHTHAPNLLAFALAEESLPSRYEALLRYGQADAVPVVPWAPRGSARSVSSIVEKVTQHPGTQAVLLGNHGVLVFASGPARAVTLLSVLEEAAEAELAARTLGGAIDFPVGALDDVKAGIARGLA